MLHLGALDLVAVDAGRDHSHREEEERDAQVESDAGFSHGWRLLGAKSLPGGTV
jgi:hypothetical protein